MPFEEPSSRPTPTADRKRGRANGLAATAVFAMVVAFALPFTMLTSSDYANKFENGELPAGINPVDGQVAAVMSIVAAAAAIGCAVGALCSRKTLGAFTALVFVALSLVFFAPLTLISLELAF
ncbi:hypothetical protein LV457_19965 [Mycobacterium sp. MYCO198283]|uniref:hypothetical protein n=1 Tax=Mycobacterium sp. MYCO198283 TaxID=2883505 RepID=UPI001E31A0C8|nr:hypothetical protein [Mycobacterium sp. MYCO198283]MCG5434548.1 hypothetical protein [Mycobacterium sp. MYCO198283]